MTAMTALPAFACPPRSQRDLLWEHCRNNLGIARLLLRERRPEPLVATACEMAVETAVRAALHHAGEPFAGHVGSALRQLEAPADLWPPERVHPSQHLAEAERVVGWLSGYLRRAAPERHWGY